MGVEARCSGSRSPLGAAERSPQDFTLFLIDYRRDLSANVREAAALDNTCEGRALALARAGRDWRILSRCRGVECQPVKNLLYSCSIFCALSNCSLECF